MLKNIFLFLWLTLFIGAHQTLAREKPRLFEIRLDGKTGYIDRSGRVVIEPKFDNGWKFSEGFACVVVGGKTGFIDEAGNYLVKPQFNSSYGCYEEFQDGFAAVEIGERVKVNGKWIDQRRLGVVDTKGKVTYFPGVTFIDLLGEGLIVFEKNGRTGLMDTNFKTIVEPKFKSVGKFKEGLARATDARDNSQYYIDRAGNVIFGFEQACDFQDGLACFRVGDKWGHIDRTGKLVIEAKYDSTGYFGDNGLVKVKIEGRWGFIDKTGKIIIEPQFDEAGEFHEGLASVEVGGKWGFIDETGAIVIAPQFDKWTYWFEGGICEIRLDGKTGYIDQSGSYVWAPSK